MKKSLAILMAAMMAISLTACGGNTTQKNENNDSSEDKTQVGSENEIATEGERTSEPVKGGVLSMPITGEPTTLNAWQIRNTIDMMVGTICYETLTAYDESGAAIPNLLESISGDPETLTYTLIVKEGVKFHDGSTLDAEAVAWNIQYYIENGVLSSSFYGNVESVKVVDDREVAVHFSSWDSLFPATLARTCYVISKEAFDKNGQEYIEQNPCGTGPFQYVNWERGVKVVFDRFDEYWRGAPNLDKVEMVIYSEPLVIQAALENGDLQAWNTTDYDFVDELVEEGFHVNKSAIASTAYTVCFNATEASPLSDVKVRKALAYAIDSDAIVNTLCANYGTVSNQWALEGADQYHKDVEGYPYNPETAKQLLAEAGYANGFETTITCQADDILINCSQILADQLSKIGVTAAINSVETANYSNYIGKWDGILLHPMGAYNGQYSQVGANFRQGLSSGLGIHAFDYPDDVNEAIINGYSSDESGAREAFNSAVKLIIDDYCFIKPAFLSKEAGVESPKLHDSGLNAISRNSHTLWKAWLEQ